MWSIFAFFLTFFCMVSFNAASGKWDQFKMTYNKTYDDYEEDKTKELIFNHNMKKIIKHNEKFSRGESTFFLEMNRFGDMDLREFVKKMNGYKPNSKILGEQFEPLTEFLEPANVVLPPHVDWRDSGAVTPVKDQGQCGSCWAFSTTGSLEGQHFRHNGTLISLSEQNLVDCSTQFGNQGCDGGWMNYAFTYVKMNHGLDTEKSYPYEGKDDQCRYKPGNSGADDSGYVNIPAGNEAKLQAAVATVGPISVAIDAGHTSFQFYKGGVYHEPECSTEELDHAVLVVGYGTDNKTNKDYWLVKNSWNTTWGEQGYIRMSRNQENNCGIASKASYPLVKP